MEFLRLFLRRHLAGKQVVASPNVGLFLRLQKTRIIQGNHDRKFDLCIKGSLGSKKSASSEFAREIIEN